MEILQVRFQAKSSCWKHVVDFLTDFEMNEEKRLRKLSIDSDSLTPSTALSNRVESPPLALSRLTHLILSETGGLKSKGTADQALPKPFTIDLNGDLGFLFFPPSMHKPAQLAICPRDKFEGVS